jgi:hypothetical protein
MYALARNAWKYIDRDNRYDKTQEIEYDFLAPDSVNEIFDALELMKQFTSKAYALKTKQKISEKDILPIVTDLLNKNDASLDKLEILAEGFENSKRKVQLVKTNHAYRIFKELVVYYGISQIISLIQQHKIKTWEKLCETLPMRSRRSSWINVGGQLIPKASVNTLIKEIHSGKIKSWDEVHEFYQKNSSLYHEQKFQHAFASLLEIKNISPADFSKKLFKQLLKEALDCKEWMVKEIYNSRAKDYHSSFRKMMYDSKAEMEKVIGKLNDNNFINVQKKELKKISQKIQEISKTMKL